MTSTAVVVGLDRAGKRRLALAMAALIALAVVGLGVPELTRRAVQAAQRGDVGAILPLGLAGVAIAMVYAALEYLSRVAKQLAQNGLERDLQSKALVKALALPKRRVTELGDGTVLTHVMDDVPGFAQGHVGAYSGLVLGLATLMAGLAYCVFLNPVLAVSTVAFNVVFRLVTRRVDRHIDAISSAARTIRERTNDLISDLVGIKDVAQVFGREDWVTSRLKDSQDEERVTRNRQFAWTAGYADSQWMIKKFADVTIIFGVGGLLAMRGMVELSAIIAFIPASAYLYNGFSALLGYWVTQAQIAPAKRAISKFLAEPDDIDWRQLGGDGSIEFDQVSFSYGEHVVLDRVSFRIEPGEWVEVQGRNGAGKSTVVALMLGLLQPDSGEIRRGSGDQRGVVYLPQSTPVFDGESTANIALDNPVARNRVDDLVNELALSHRTGAEVSEFSTGEVRRIGAARALARLPESNYLIGDEITAGLDADNTDRVLGLLRTHAGAATVVLINHDHIDLPFTARLIVGDGRVEVERLETK
ncbi:hypothetical protein CGZ91_13010 [Parenemella sanctibonifatiensis]|uniref:ABC transporter ATP-binding protein n=2 Tax=Parenemella sanctibonifatiensis TaxID=2016505 RepID=A0A255EAD9_9ACTN|nr:hypothetical protein CGZ91_13010 [Parenemella sanctibonifatiensis]